MEEKSGVTSKAAAIFFLACVINRFLQSITWPNRWLNIADKLRFFFLIFHNNLGLKNLFFVMALYFFWGLYLNQLFLNHQHKSVEWRLNDMISSNHSFHSMTECQNGPLEQRKSKYSWVNVSYQNYSHKQIEEHLWPIAWEQHLNVTIHISHFIAKIHRYRVITYVFCQMHEVKVNLISMVYFTKKLRIN